MSKDASGALLLTLISFSPDRYPGLRTVRMQSLSGNPVILKLPSLSVKT
jgi:hypothetical protein